MDAIKFAIVFLITLVGSSAYDGQYPLMFTFLGMGGVLALGEIITIKKTGKSISKNVWDSKKKQ